jgi:RHS repeat-associated protein
MNQRFTYSISPPFHLFADIYTFSAKERDPETGLSYFGSRYYSSDLSIWLSVDPMSDKYPSLSPYTYCANNPVKFVDPNGEKFRLIGRKTNIAFRNYLLSYKGVNCENMYEAFSLAYSNSNVIMFRDPNITYEQFASNYYKTTGEKLKNKDPKKLFKSIKSDVFIEVNLVSKEAIPEDCMFKELSHEKIMETLAFATEPQSGNPALDKLMVEICSDEFNAIFNSSAANFETSDSKFFSNISGDKTMLNPPLGIMMVNACGKSAKQAQDTLVKELLDFYDKLK